MKKKKKKLKLKTSVKVFIVIVILACIGIKIGLDKYNEYLYQQTYEYKLLQKNYSKEEIDIILDKLDEDYVNSLLEKDYVPKLSDFLKEKYFIRNRLERYLDYYQKNPKSDVSDIVTLVNVNRDYKFYDKVFSTDISKGILMLVNKYYYLEENYVPEELVKVSSQYGYDGNSARKDVLDAFIDMANSAKEEGITLIINSSYRNYQDQKKTWDNKRKVSGEKAADAFAARPGFSEHQSGLALDINEFASTADDFEETKAFEWLSKNASLYGFILRYPKDKEDITGYSYESWHYRYVGKDTALKVFQSGLTYEEYYAYYIENNQFWGVIMARRKKMSFSSNYFFFFLILLAFGIYMFVSYDNESISYAFRKKDINVSQEVLKGLKVSFLDVGQADSILVQVDKENMLIDAGNNNDGKNLVSYLKSQNINSFNYVFGTHAHEDHIGGLDDVIDSFDINHFYMPDVATTTKTFEDVLNALEVKSVAFETPNINDKLKLGDALIEVIYVGKDEKNLNNDSIVLRLDYKNISLLFMGDLEMDVEKELLDKNIDVDILKVGHHGSNTSSSNEFLDKVSPNYAIISVGKYNSYKHPSDNILKRLSDKGVEIFRTDEKGSIILTSDGESINFSSLITSIDGG